MALPTSIWVKFKDDQIKVTYLGVEYTLPFVQSGFGPWGAGYFLALSGDTTNGTILSFAIDQATIPPNIIGEFNVELTVMVDGVVSTTNIVGIIECDGSAVIAVSGPDITAATIIHRDSRLPKLLELPYISQAGKFYVAWADNSVAIQDFEASLDLLKFYLGDGEVEEDYSFSLDTNNVGTTDCPFVEWIGELATVETFTTSGPWTTPANIDTTKPVIVECWGAGANGADGTTGAGGAGGGGGTYASAEFSLRVYETPSWNVSVPSGGSGENVSFNYVGMINEFVSAESGWEQFSGLAGGDVSFSGGDGATGNGLYGGAGGAGASPFADGADATSDVGVPGWGVGEDNGRSGDGASDIVAANVGFSPGGGGGGGFGDGSYQTGGTGAAGLVKIHYSLQVSSPSTPSDVEVETIELNEIYDNIEVTFATGGIPRKRGINSHSMISGVRANSDIDRVD